MCERDLYIACEYYASTYLGILLQGATMPSLHPNFIFVLSWGCDSQRAICFDLSRV